MYISWIFYCDLHQNVFKIKYTYINIIFMYLLFELHKYHFFYIFRINYKFLLIKIISKEGEFYHFFPFFLFFTLKLCYIHVFEKNSSIVRSIIIRDKLTIVIKNEPYFNYIFN